MVALGTKLKSISKVEWELPGTGRRGNEELLVSGCRVSILQMSRVLEMDAYDGYTTM